MQRYESYKPSGVKWIGDVPSHWEVRPGFTCFKENKRRNKKLAEKTVLSLSYGRIVIKSEEKMTGLVPETFESYQLIKPGDIVIRTTDLQNDKTSLRVGLAKDQGMITSAYLGLCCNPEMNPDYMYRLLESFDALKVFYGMGSGLRQNIDFVDFKRLPITVPPRAEQDRIVTFLDQKTAEIDTAIAKKKRLIELLQEQKSILINQAVTRGLNPDVPMRDSEVEWIGEIPKGWSVVPVTKYTQSIVDYRGKTPEKVESGIFLVTARNIKKGHIDYALSQEYVSEKEYPKIMYRGMPNIGDLLFTMEAPLGEVALVDREDVAFAQRIIKLRLKRDRLLPSFTLYAMTAQYFQSLLKREATGSTALGIKASKLHKLKIAAPSTAEQDLIVDYLDNATAKIEGVLQHMQSQIQSLVGFKSNLIAAVVTGKLRVKGK